MTHVPPHGTPPTAPPSLAEHVLRASVRDPEWREAVLGDLREEFAGVVQHRGGSAARRWYWRESLPLAARFAASRVLPAAAHRAGAAPSRSPASRR